MFIQHEYLKLIKSDIKDDEIMRGFFFKSI